MRPGRIRQPKTHKASAIVLALTCCAWLSGCSLGYEYDPRLAAAYNPEVVVVRFDPATPMVFGYYNVDLGREWESDDFRWFLAQAVAAELQHSGVHVVLAKDGADIPDHIKPNLRYLISGEITHFDRVDRDPFGNLWIGMDADVFVYDIASDRVVLLEPFSQTGTTCATMNSHCHAAALGQAAAAIGVEAVDNMLTRIPDLKSP